MKRLLVPVVLLCALPTLLTAENRAREQGTIVRMRMADCLVGQHPLMDALSGSNRGPAGEVCPEYVLVTDKVVYVIIGRSSDQLVPLAETTRFRIQNNEVLIRLDDSRRESRFRVKEMVLRPAWERDQQVAEAEMTATARQHMEDAAIGNTQPAERAPGR